MSRGLLNQIMNDGSRLFAELAESASFSQLRDHVAALDGVVVASFLSDDVTEAWIDFAFRGYQFTINNQFGDYWFFVVDPRCPDDILLAVIEHCRSLLAS